MAAMNESFYTRLQKRKNSLTVFNPYREVYKLDNLKAYLDQVMAQDGPRVLLVGEALGFKGGRLTGIPFSSGRLFSEVDHPFLKQLQPQLRLPDLDSENTASIVWQYLCKQTTAPLFWNAFPFHPHPLRLQRKNRAPNRAEINEGGFFLQEIIEHYQPVRIAGLGRKGVDAVQKVLGISAVEYIRHPSYGGKTEFIAGMERLFSE